MVGVVYDENTRDFLVNAEVSFEELGLSVSTGEGGRFDVVAFQTADIPLLYRRMAIRMRYIGICQFPMLLELTSIHW